MRHLIEFLLAGGLFALFALAALAGEVIGK